MLDVFVWDSRFRTSATAAPDGRAANTLGTAMQSTPYAPVAARPVAGRYDAAGARVRRMFVQSAGKRLRSCGL